MGSRGAESCARVMIDVGVGHRACPMAKMAEPIFSVFQV